MERIEISEKNKKILDKYPEINYKKYIGMEASDDNLDNLLEELDSALIRYRDENDEPLEEWLEIERVRDEIYYDYFR